ncbi:MAG: cyclic nucleotide-binding domain-containing protein [Pseudomonadales bacterium]
MSVTPDQDLISILDRIAIFGGLELGQQQKLLHMMDEKTYSDGEVIFRKGESGSCIYIVIDGRVALDFEQDDHPLSDLRLHPGACFGETSVIGVQPHAATTRAEGKTRVLALPSSSLYQLYETDLPLFASVILNFAREASRRLHATDELFLQTSKMQELKKKGFSGL